MRRDHWRRRHDTLDPEVDFVEIVAGLTMHEFPWDLNQALSFALFRTYAVPGIGGLLARTGEFTSNVQQRYDDTALLLEPPVRLGFDHPESRAAIRRINQMHRSYDIANHQMRYVLATFVVVPQRWLATYGKRPLTPGEIEATVHYYRALGRHLGIRDLPATFEEFATLMDDYEAEHFAVDPGGRAVADATLALMQTFYPRLLARPAELFARALMDPPLREALRYDAPPRPVEWAARAGLRARGQLLRLFPARRLPKRVEDLSWVRSYPDGYRIEELGTFPTPGVRGCPVRHEADTSPLAD